MINYEQLWTAPAKYTLCIPRSLGQHIHAHNGTCPYLIFGVRQLEVLFVNMMLHSGVALRSCIMMLEMQQHVGAPPDLGGDHNELPRLGTAKYTMCIPRYSPCTHTPTQRLLLIPDIWGAPAGGAVRQHDVALRSCIMLMQHRITCWCNSLMHTAQPLYYTSGLAPNAALQRGPAALKESPGLLYGLRRAPQHVDIMCARIMRARGRARSARAYV